MSSEIELVEDKKHKDMFRLKWSDGTISVSTPHPDRKDGHYGFYNKTWAKEHIKRWEGQNLTLDQTYNSPMARNIDR